MNEKFSLYNIAEILAERTGLDVAKAEKFVEQLIEVTNEGITKDQIVKVKSIGTFKVIQVKERESVHVNTGERIVIPSHHKLSFIPDKNLKELINKPFSFFETIEASAEDDDSPSSDDSSFPETDDEQMEENDILADEIALDSDEEDEIITPPMQSNEVNEVESAGNQAVDVPLPSMPPPIPVQKQEETVAEKRIEVDQLSESRQMIKTPPPILDTNAIDEVSLTSEQAVDSALNESDEEVIDPTLKQAEDVVEKKKKSSTTPLVVLLILLILVLLGGCVWYFFFYSKSFNNLNSEVYSTRVTGDSFSLPGDTVAMVDVEKEIQVVKDSTSNQGGTADLENGKPAVDETAGTPGNAEDANSSSSSNEILAKVKIGSGDRLTLIAEKYYGNKIFWVYIYEYNKKKIGSNPNNVRTGMEILVPSKNEYGIDANDAASREKAINLQAKIMSGVK